MSAPGDLAATHLHRATRLTSLYWLQGREALIAADLADLVARNGHAAETMSATGAMVTVQLRGAHGAWSRHVWSRREGARVIAETVVEDGDARLAALGIDPIGETARLAARHRPTEPFGELHAGTGQLAASPHAVLPPDFPEAAGPLAHALHRLWNGGQYTDAMAPWHPAVRWSGAGNTVGDRTALRDWIMRWRARFADAVILFETAAVGDDRIAVLWRLHGTTASRRIRLLGSTLVTVTDGLIVADETLLDPVAARVQGVG